MELLPLVTFFVAIVSSVLSGMSGGGGGFIMTPYFLLIGLSPQQIVAGGSVASLGLGSSSLVAMRGQGLITTRFLWPLAGLTLCATLLAMLVLPKIESELFMIVMGMLLIVLAPTLFIKKQRFQPGGRSNKSIIFGYITYGIILFASSLGSGVATLLFLPLMFLMGLTVIQANALRRTLLILQAAITFCVVLPLGWIVWSHTLACLVGCYIGGFIGTKIALRRGETFVKYTLASIMIISGIALLLSS